jgi:uncharacterized protein (TIGR04168 family)
MNEQIKIAVVGDVHNQWELQDHLALHSLKVDLVLFVGDFGNESREIVGKIASLDLPKATIMGNHDAWYTATDWGRKKSPYNHDQEDWVQEQLDLLGAAHVGYGKLDLPNLGISIVGGRPFTWGGPKLVTEKFLAQRYGINNFTESGDRIFTQAQQTTQEHLIFLGHNGPLGLGDQPEDMVGRDWKPLGGDFGDPDLAEAIAKVRYSGKHIPLVTFGHMHHTLRHRKDILRTRVKICNQGTVYLNAASVPRIKEIEGIKYRNFSLVTMENYTVQEIRLVWLKPDFELDSQEILYST